MKIKIHFIATFLLLNLSVYSQSFKLYCDTVNFAYKSQPWFYISENIFDEIPTADLLSIDKYKKIFLNQEKSYFTLQLKVNKPTFIQVVNTDILALQGQVLHGTFKGLFQFNSDSLNINYILQEVINRLKLYNKSLNSQTSLVQKQKVYLEIKNEIDKTVAHIQSPEIKTKYDLSPAAIASVKDYLKSFQGNFLFSSYWIGNSTDIDFFIRNRKDVKIINPLTLLEFQGGRNYLQRYFFITPYPRIIMNWKIR